MDVRELEETFLGVGEVKGYKFVQINKTDFGYIYSVFSGENTKDHHYEVFKRKLVHLYDFKEKKKLEDMKVMYPKSNAFGVWAWTYKDYNEALAKLESFYVEQENKESV